MHPALESLQGFSTHSGRPASVTAGLGAGRAQPDGGRLPWTAASRGDVLAGAGEEMAWLYVREPVSAWTHGLSLLLSLPGSYVLWRLSRGDWVKRAGMLAFGLGLA